MLAAQLQAGHHASGGRWYSSPAAFIVGSLVAIALVVGCGGAPSDSDSSATAKAGAWVCLEEFPCFDCSTDGNTICGKGN